MPGDVSHAACQKARTAHAGGRFAAQRFDAFAGVRLEFVEGEFEFPALVVEGGELRSGVGGGVAERGEEPIGAEAAALDADGADAEREGQVGMLGTGRRAGAQLDEGIAGAEALDDGLREGGGPAAGAHDPVAVAVRRRERVRSCRSRGRG